MSILLLCKGDEQAKELLRNSIAIHYGNNPIAFDAVQYNTAGKILHTFGPLKLRLSLKIDTYFQFPSQFRQDYELSLLKIPIRKQSETFDGKTYYLKTGNQPVTTSQDVAFFQTVRQRLWAFSAAMLMPLSEMFVELEYVNETCLIAHNSEAELSAHITFYDNYQLQRIITASPHYDDKFAIEMSQETEVIDGRKVYKHLIVGWNDQPTYTLHTSSIEIMEELDSAIFRIE